MSTRTIALSTFWQLASQITMAGLSIITVKFVAIALTKELAGIYNSAYGFLQVFGILADFGLYAVAVSEVSAAAPTPNPSPKGGGGNGSGTAARFSRIQVLNSLIVLRAIILCLSLGSAIAIAWVIPHWQGTPLPLSISLAALVPFFTLLAGMLRTVFQVYYRMHYVFIAEVAQRIVSTGGIVALVLWLGLQGSSNPTYVYYFFLFGGLGSLLLFVLSWQIGRRILPFSLRCERETVLYLLKRAAPYGIAFLCVALYRQFDLTMIALLRDDFEIQNAYYGFVIRMTDMGFLIPTFLLNSTLPLLSSGDTRQTQHLLQKTMLILLLLGSVSALFSFFWARPLVALLTTEQYLSTALTPGSDTALKWMSIPLFCNGMILYGFYVLLHRHIWRRLVCSLLCAAVASLALNMWLISLYGFMGAVATSIIVHLFLACILVPQGLRVMRFSFPFSTLVRWLLFSVGLGVFLAFSQSWLVSEITTVIGLAAATVVMGVLFVGMGLWRSIKY